MTALGRRRSRPQGAGPSRWRRRCCRSVVLQLAILFLSSIVAAAQPQPGVASARGEVLKAFAAGQYDKAEALAAIFPRDESMVVLRAQTFLVRGDYERAYQLLQPVAGENPGGEAALELGLLQRYIGQRGQGRRTLELLRLAQGPGTATREFLRAGRAARANGRTEEAKALYTEAARETPNDAAVNTEWGSFLLQGHNTAEAIKSFQQAIKADANYQPALVGLARATMETNPPAAARLVKRVLELNPSNPEAHLVDAELAIDEERRKEALEAIQRALVVNPKNLEALALQAAVAFVEGRQADYQTSVDAALAINPLYGEVYRVTGAVLARSYRFDEAVEQTTRATRLDRENARAFADLGAHLMRTGDERNARRPLDMAFRADTYDLVTYNLLELLDKLATFETIKDETFIIKLHPDEAGVMREYAPALAHEALASLMKRWDFTPKGPLLIEIFPVHDDFAVRTAGLPGMIGALGACFGRVVTLDSPKARPPGEFNWGATLWHELAHVITLQLSDQRVPRWLTEGISVFEETRAERGWGREMEIPFARALDEGRVLKLKDLNAGFQDPRTISLAYYEASLLVEHIVAVHGDAALKALVQSFAGGITTEEAVTRVLKSDLDTLQTSFDGFLATRFDGLRKALTTPEDFQPGLPVDKLKALAESHPDSYAVQAALGEVLQTTDGDAAFVAFERAVALVPQATGAESPYGLMVQLALKRGDRARAAKVLDAWTARDHTDIEAARRLVTLLEESGAANEGSPARDQLKVALQRVVAIDPFDAPSHATLGRMALEASDGPGAVRNFRVALAAGPVDRASAHADLAEGLFVTGARDEAKRQTLAALEIAPTFERAQDLLLKLVEGGDRR